MDKRKKETQYDFCAYRGCVKGKFTTNSRLYRFPAKNDPRLAVWVENSGNKRLKWLAVSTLRSCGLCEEHFESTCFTGKNQRLSRDAVPKKFIETFQLPPETPNAHVANEVEERRMILKKYQTPVRTSIIGAKWRLTEDVVPKTSMETVQLPPETPTAHVANEVEERRVISKKYQTPESTSIIGEKRPLTGEAVPKTSMKTVQLPPETPNAHVANEVEERRVISKKYQTPVSTMTTLEPLRSVGSDLVMRHNCGDKRNCTPSRGAASIGSNAPSSTAANTVLPVSKHEQTYRKAAVDFSKSDDNNCTWRKIEPSSKPLTEETLLKLTSRLNAQVEKLEKSNMTLKRKQFLNRKKIQILQRNLRKASKKIMRHKCKPKKESIDDFLDRQKCTEPAARTMVKLQLHHKNAPYSEEEIDLARQLYFYSPSVYTRLKNAGCSFPSGSSVRRWVSEVDIKPGFCNLIFNKLAEKISLLPPEERVCALKFDEMSIKIFQEYSQKFDCIDEILELGSLGHKDERARYVFLFCVDGLNANNPWRQPLAYFLPGSGMKAPEIYKLLKECLCRLFAAGADVFFINCNQGPSNQNLFNKYLKVSVEKPFFTIEENEYFASFDFSHLIKRLLSMLRTHELLYCNGEVIANYQDFVDTWEYDNCSTTTKMLSHITKAHWHPSSFEAMNVKRALQILSHSFGAAILIAGQNPEGLKSNTWHATAAFTERMSKVIDACNAYKLLCDIPTKRPLSDRNPEIEKILVDFVQWSADWTVLANTKTKLMKKVPCLIGLPLSVNAILNTYSKIKSKYPKFELATALCNQDSVEDLFSELRKLGGQNPYPTTRMVRLSLGYILSPGYSGIGNSGNIERPEAVVSIEPRTMVTRTLDQSDGMFETPIEDVGDEDPVEVEEAAEMFQYEIIEFETTTASTPPNDNP